ncbi:hypothetical protein [uncultured Gammaproteobacteria bacterium]|jgi:hypothetical protein|uniref:DUF4926 domain-containing protein n=1 Tax=Bathymodiolus thermophilus thioautotrophic gill symbiont TaxID=2360 RepID=A0ABN7GE62_9GAMM|nr:DUF4926 domain-containing protein [Bathymodiolus thermophilus thioautotrophic gill symbiont]CAB5508118.1 hypothetical protein AZO1586I_2393 [Bathymodiolus thermophilus thioautotrophic gill symbiont]CAC9500896.1 hypothetical protein [uncultured Gammaproteobacteria bacterium]CAC9556238.1 hypothetical protein [uncultured Gammaproteobacteria bacterium]VVH55849.1 hypothetical protein BAZOLSSOX_1046 [uncultured Gammaproteobacteria bacterium]
MISQYDVVKSLINIPKENLFIGDRGTVVEDFDDDYCLVEFLQKDSPIPKTIDSTLLIHKKDLTQIQK